MISPDELMRVLLRIDARLASLEEWVDSVDGIIDPELHGDPPLVVYEHELYRDKSRDN